jgi:exopolysaccharide biosynthesis polyprenyl glycosylphosphotransferase
VNLPFDQPATEPSIAPQVSELLPKIYKRQSSKLSSYATPIAFVVDYLSICAGSIAALQIYNAFGGSRTGHELANFLAFSVQYTLAFVLFGKIHSLYNYKHNLLKVRDTAAILRVSLFCFLLLTVESLFSQILIPLILLVLSCGIITLFVLFEKHAARRIFARWKAKEAGERQVLILGSGEEARRLFSFLLNSPDLELRPIGFFEEQPSDGPRVVYSHDYQFKDHATVHTGQLDAGTLHRLNVSEIFMADPTLSPQRLAEIAHLAAQHGTPLSFVAPVQVPGIGKPVNFQVMDGLFVTAYSGPHESSFGYVVAKRILDISVCIAMFLVSLPVWIVAALWVKLSSDGPIFFEQERIGFKGVPFKMLKFRSMYVTAPKYGRSPEDAYDPRITAAGRFLRKTSLDELPQLINVFRGEMSLVGPRPEMPYVVEEYTQHQKQRLEVPQGLTGMWQLSADRKYAIHQSIEYDLYYIENRGIFLDLAILLHTAVFAMKGI